MYVTETGWNLYKNVSVWSKFVIVMKMQTIPVQRFYRSMDFMIVKSPSSPRYSSAKIKTPSMPWSKEDTVWVLIWADVSLQQLGLDSASLLSDTVYKL